VYRNLRIGLGVTALMVVVSIIIQSTYKRWHIDKHCVQSFLSDYFYTSAHSIFVAGLLGLATLFFIYRGTTDTENVLLTLAGVGALTAALVPEGAGYVNLCPPLFIPDKVDVATAIRPNLFAIVAALALAWVITLFQRCRKDAEGNPIPRMKKSTGGKWARGILLLVVVAGLIALLTPGFNSRDIAHAVAGVLLLSSFIATVFTTAFVASRETALHRFYKIFYWACGGVMLLTFVAILMAEHRWPDFFRPRLGTWVEGAVLAEFCVYWVVQTFDLWDTPDRIYRLSCPDRRRLEGMLVQSTDEPSRGDKIMSFL
jgi:hypothetical protein